MNFFTIFLFIVTMVAMFDGGYPGRLWKMADIVTKNRFFFFFNSLNIVKSQCCYQAIKEQCIYNSLSDHECRCFLPSFGSFGQMVSEEKNLIFSTVFYFLLIFFTIYQVWEAATAIKPYGKNAYVVFFQNIDWRPPAVIQRGRHLQKIENIVKKHIQNPVKSQRWWPCLMGNEVLNHSSERILHMYQI
jgi:hypothetical protein